MCGVGCYASHACPIPCRRPVAACCCGHVCGMDVLCCVARSRRQARVLDILVRAYKPWLPSVLAGKRAGGEVRGVWCSVALGWEWNDRVSVGEK